MHSEFFILCLTVMMLIYFIVAIVLLIMVGWDWLGWYTC